MFSIRLTLREHIPDVNQYGYIVAATSGNGRAHPVGTQIQLNLISGFTWLDLFFIYQTQSFTEPGYPRHTRIATD